MPIASRDFDPSKADTVLLLFFIFPKHKIQQQQTNNDMKKVNASDNKIKVVELVTRGSNARFQLLVVLKAFQSDESTSQKHSR